MRINKEEDYIIRIIRCLSNEDKFITAQTISENEHITKAEVFKLIKKLKANKLVKCKSGVMGGYMLDVDLHNVTLLELFNMLDKDININECLNHGSNCPNNDGHRCNVHKKLLKIQEKILDELKSESIYEILYGK